MDFVSKYVLRGAGFLVAAQIFLTLGLTQDGIAEKLSYAGKLAVLPMGLLAVGSLLSSENSLRTAGFTILLWAGAGATMFFGAVYGDPEVYKIPMVSVPQPHQLSLGFGLTNLALVILAGVGLWLWGLKLEPAPGTYHDLGVSRR